MLNLTMGLMSSLLLFLFAEPVLLAMGLRPELMVYGKPYLQIVGSLAFAQAITTTISAILRAANKPIYPMLVIVVVHPSKLKKDEQIDSLYNASGSAEFRNRADYGLVLVNDDKCHRSPGSSYDLHVLKVIIDKVLVHKGLSTLDVLMVGLIIGL